MVKPMEESKEIKIGVTGHRILMEVDKIIDGLDRALNKILDVYGDRPLVVLSSLAEGVDRIVAEVVLGRPDAKLIAVIPFGIRDYASDFGDEGSASRVHFNSLLHRASKIIKLTKAPTRDEGYAQCGNYISDHCDVLIAVWDGKKAQGIGGTGETVARARSMGKPVVIVRAGNRKPGTNKPTSLGKKQGSVITEGFPE
jgi:hypothetical protein